MPDNKFIKIFLASSSELKDDREQFEIFINRKNKEYIQKNIFLELVLWEDFLDVMSPTRLQDEYNKAIANCDVFVSLFYTKVGQYTEEEFLKALETFKANKRPLIYTYFKDSPINLSEIDAEINSLLNFKKKLSTLGHFYRTYNDINHLKELFNEQLPKLMEKFKKVASNAGLNQASAAQLSKNAGKSIYIGFRTAIPDYNDFQGREQELEELENKLQQSRVIAICGNPGIGKTYLAAKLAQRLSKCYQVCWIDKDELTLDELFLEINDFLQENNEQGFITTYSKEKEDGLTIPIESKISALIHVIQGSLATKFAFFIQTVPKYLKDFIERFRTSKGDSRLIIIDRYLEESLGLMLFDKLGKLEVKEYSHDDAVNRISYQLSNQSKIQCSSEEITKICEKTDNHPFAIDLVIGLIREGKINLPSELSLKEILVYDKNNEVGLCQKLFSEIKKYLNKQEKEALGHLSVFRTSVNSGVREYLNISQSVWNSLLKRSFLKFIGNNQFRLTYIIATTWAISQSKEQILSSHKKAAYYYCTLGQDSLEKFQKLDQKAYLESYYHWRQIEKNSQEDVEKKEAIRQSAMVLNDLINQIHQVERLPSERLPGVEEWLFTLDNALLSKTPWVLLEKGRKLEKRGDYGKAKEIFTQATQIFSNNNNGEFGYSIALYYVGKMLYLLQQYQRAIEKLGKVWEIANHRADSSMEIRTLAKISSCNIELGQEIEAENAAKTAERIARETEDLLGLALILYRQGSIKRHQGYFRDAEDLFTASAKQFHELGDRYKEAKSLVRLGICQKFQGKYESAKSNLTKAISIKESINDWHGIARDKDYLGDIYRDLGKYDKAEKLYQESLEIKEGNDKIERDNYGIIKAYNNLARMALLTHQVNKCKAWVTKSEALIREHSEYIAGLDGSRLMIQGDLYSIQGNYESALKSYNRSAQCFQAPNPKVPHSYARNILNLGQTYLILGKFEDSLKYLNQTAKLFEDYKMIKYQCLSLTYLSIIKSLMLLIDEAITCNHQARQIADEDIKGDSKMLSITCLESQGFIEKIKILTNLSDEDNIEKLLTPVDSNYEEALNLCQKLCHNKNNTYYRLKSKKYFWW